MQLKESQTGTISASESFCSQFCTGGSFCWNYGTDTFYGNYAGDNNCCICAAFEVVLSVTSMLVDRSVTIMQMTVSAANMRVSFYCNHADGSNYAGGIFCSGLYTLQFLL